MITRSNIRTDRIAAELRRLLTIVLREQVKDPRLADLTIQEVRVTRGLAQATVFFTCFNSEHAVEVQTRLLNQQLAGFLRHAIAQVLRLRTVPQLHFVYDNSIGYSEHLSALIDIVAAQLPPERSADQHQEQSVNGT